MPASNPDKPPTHRCFQATTRLGRKPRGGGSYATSLWAVITNLSGQPRLVEELADFFEGFALTI